MKHRNKNWWLLAVGLVIFWSFMPSASAHVPGQPPFVYVNDQPAGFYFVGYSSLPDLKLPQDAAPANYVVNKPVDLKLETSALPLFPEEILLYTFHWDFGDGTSANGLEFKHIYTTPGTKTVVVTSQDTRTTDPAQLMSSMYINILPRTDYKLPKPVLIVNGITASNYLTDKTSADFTKHVVLDASHSVVGSSPITSYTWDLGNKQLAYDAKATVTYQQIFSSVLPVIRLTTKDGFYVDGTIGITNTQLHDVGATTTEASVPTDNPPASHRDLLIGLTVAGIALLSGAFVLWRKRSAFAHGYHYRR